MYCLTSPDLRRRIRIQFLDRPLLQQGAVLLLDVSSSMMRHTRENLEAAAFANGVAAVVWFASSAGMWDEEKPEDGWHECTNYEIAFLEVLKVLGSGSPLVMITDGNPNEGGDWRVPLAEIREMAGSIHVLYFGEPNREGMTNINAIATNPPEAIADMNRLLERLRSIFNPFAEEQRPGGAVGFGAVQVSWDNEGGEEDDSDAGDRKEKLKELTELKDSARVAAVVASVTAFMRANQADALPISRYMKKFLSRFTGKRDSFGFQQMIEAFQMLEAEAGVASLVPGLANLLRGAAILSAQTPTITEKQLDDLHDVARIAAASLPTDEVRGHARRLRKAKLSIQARLGQTGAALRHHMGTVLGNQSVLDLPLTALDLSCDVPEFKKGCSIADADSKSFVAATMNPACVRIDLGSRRQVTDLTNLEEDAALIMPQTHAHPPHQAKTKDTKVRASLLAIATFVTTGQKLMKKWAPMAFVGTLIRLHGQESYPEKEGNRELLVQSLKAYVAETPEIQRAFELLRPERDSLRHLVFGTPLQAGDDRLPFPMGMVVLAGPLFIPHYSPVQCLAPLLHETIKACSRERPVYSEFQFSNVKVLVQQQRALVELLASEKTGLGVTVQVDEIKALEIISRCLAEAKANQHPLPGISHSLLTLSELLHFWLSVTTHGHPQTPTSKMQIHMFHKQLMETAGLLALAAKLSGSVSPSSQDLAKALAAQPVHQVAEGRYQFQLCSSTVWGKSLLGQAMKGADLPTEAEELRKLAMYGVDIMPAIKALRPLPASLLTAYLPPDTSLFERVVWSDIKLSSVGNWSNELVKACLDFLAGLHCFTRFHRAVLAKLIPVLKAQDFKQLDSKITLEALRDSDCLDLQPGALNKSLLQEIAKSLETRWNRNTDAALVARLCRQPGALSILQSFFLKALAGDATKSSLHLAACLREAKEEDLTPEIIQAANRDDLSLTPMTPTWTSVVTQTAKGYWAAVKDQKVHTPSYQMLYRDLVVDDHFRYGLLTRNHCALRAACKPLPKGCGEAEAKRRYEALVQLRKDKLSVFAPDSKLARTMAAKNKAKWEEWLETRDTMTAQEQAAFPFKSEPRVPRMQRFRTHTMLAVTLPLVVLEKVGPMRSGIKVTVPERIPL